MRTLRQAIELSMAGRNDEAVAIVRDLAASGDPQALAMLAEMTWRGGMVAQDPVQARMLYERAAAAGHETAGVICTNLLASGVAGRRDWKSALARLAGEAGNYPQRQLALQLLQAMSLDPEGNPSGVPNGEELSKRPKAWVFRNLLTREECTYVLRLTQDSFEPSLVYNNLRQLVRDPIRTSDGATIHWLIEDPAVHAINRRIAAITGTDYTSGEALQLLRYSPGQEYRPHFDFVAGAQNRRLWTALVYLNEEYAGGETAFVRTGLKVRGRTGDVLVFGNAAEDGGPEPLAEHAGLPVTSGTKFLATRWIRERRWIP
jgi:prolyl 4-hydroxylase